MSDSTLEENIRQALLETVQFTHTSGNNIEIQPDQATQALLSLYQKELVRELERLDLAVLRPCKENCTDVEHAYHKGTWDSHQIIDKRINELIGEQP